MGGEVSDPETVEGATRLLIVDDHRMFVDSLVRLLDDEPDLVVVGLAYTIADAVRVIGGLSPDVVLLDYRLPDGDAPACLAQLHDAAPAARVLVMTGLSDEATLSAARAAGSHGVVTKDRAAHDLVESIRAVARGSTIAAPAPEAPGRSRVRAAAERPLSTREREVLAQLAAGRSTDEIARALAISPVTVRNHIQRILPKLGAHSRLEAVALAIEAGIIAPPRSRSTRG